MPSYLWYQAKGGEDIWVEALSEHRERVLAERRPAFVTVLDAFSSPEKDWDREEYSKMAYQGPFYADFDGSFDDTVTNFHKFLKNLEDAGVKLKCLRLYATGGRGFHIEIPQQVFIHKLPKAGTKGLPYIYREMAMDMVVDTLDLRVYTGRRGRMWRTPGIERIKDGTPTGKFKVPLTLQEALDITEASYNELCSAPREEPAREDPELSTYLSAMFVKFSKKVDDGISRQGKSTKDLETLARFKGQFPPTIERIMRGEGVAPGTGFQKLSMQLAITANALGKSSEQLVEACELLCKNHSGDSSRYGSPRKRKDELRRMWDYTHDNPCYSYSNGGIRSLLGVDERSGDLDGLAQNAGIGELADDEVTEEQTQEQKAEMSFAALGLMEGLSFDLKGVHRKNGEGTRTISNIGYKHPVQFREGVPDGSGHHTVLGVEVELIADDTSCGRHILPDRSFLSRSALSQQLSGYGGIFSGSDTQAGVVKLALGRAAAKGKKVVYALHRVGLDVVQNPLVEEKADKDIVWVTTERVVTSSKTAYTYQPYVGNKTAFLADVHKGSPIENTPETLAWVKDLLQINSPTTLAQMLGWFVSSFHRQFYHQAFQQFPLLHPCGPAGSGKTLTSQLMGRMNFMTQDPKVLSCGGMSTTFALKDAMTGSCSVPLILDEYKPSEMDSSRTNFLLQAFRLAYNQGKGASGAMSNGSAAATFRDISELTFSSPIVFCAEAQETQTAIVQRSLPVVFKSEEIKGRAECFERVQAGKENMSALGKLLLLESIKETVDSRREALTPILKELRAAFGKNVHDRQVFNLAVVLEGLNFLDRCLQLVFQEALVEDIAVLKRSIHEHKQELNQVAQSEAGKMFNDLALMSRTEGDDSEFYLREGREYIVLDGYMEMLLRETFVKYYAWCRRKGFTPYYGSSESFIKAMGAFPPTLDKACVASPLRTSAQARIFRFSLEKLAAEGVEQFKTK